MEEKIILCVNALIKKDNKILLVKRVESDNEGGLWSIPGGTVEESEALEDALSREIFEELGISNLKYNFFDIIEIFNNKTRILAFYFYTEINDNIDIKLAHNELSDYSWFDCSYDIDEDLAFNQNIIINKFITKKL